MLWSLLLTSPPAAQILAQTAATADQTSELVPWIQGGGSAAAVSGLVYVATLIVKGKLVPRAVANQISELEAQIRASADREAQVMALAENYKQVCADLLSENHEGRAREATMARVIGVTEKALERVEALLERHGG